MVLTFSPQHYRGFSLLRCLRLLGLFQKTMKGLAHVVLKDLVDLKREARVIPWSTVV
jgi:hypothetical protein